MAKFHGFIGFSETKETATGVFTEVITEREYTGDFLRAAQTLVTTQNLNDNLVLSSRISILADPFAVANISTIRYARFDGVSWKVSNVEHQRPRLILSLGGVYNG